MDWEWFAFGLLALLTLGGALAVVLPPFGRNPLHAALALLLTFTSLAGLMVMLQAHLVAAMQVLVYAGAVMVLFVFVVLLLNLRRQDLGDARVTPWKVVGVVAVLAFLGKAGTMLWAALPLLGDPASCVGREAEFGQTRAVAADLLTTYLVPFEVTSVLLLVAVVGALAIARRQRGGGAA
ncbi:MAG TPA: NADH-quinone oxidoreductase subunit J [Myxococcota bacterium]|nr:NADH-quinone oxidoreductase subunit J [Myxococcota bacterium]HQK51029.1 NADH-quinone oxidoreductase subunit J [Myxococcota bacterium]